MSKPITVLAYTSSTPKPGVPRSLVAAFVAKRNAEAFAALDDELCTEDYCFVCHRSTDHRGEHSDAQLLDSAEKRGGLALGDLLATR